MPDKHAKILQPSSAARWLHCTPSALINANAPHEDTVYTKEGTDAHSVCEYMLRKAMGEDVSDPRESLEYYDESMEIYAESYRDYCMEKFLSAGEDAHMFIEQQLDLTRWVPESFGTADCIIISDGILSLIDFKYGQGVLVQADHNEQLMTYAAGAVDTFGEIYDFTEVEMSIFQPRRASVDTFSMSKEDLLSWADNELAPKAKMAFEGKGDFHCGAWCKFCAISGECRERAKVVAQEMIEDYKEPETLSPEEIADLLPKLDEITSWVSDLREYALKTALSGTEYPGYKLVAGRSRRAYVDEEKVAETVREKGYDPYDTTIKSVAQMEKLLGKKLFNDLLGGYVTKTDGAPTLVPESDKRPAIEASGAKDYEDEVTKTSKKGEKS